MHRTLLAPMHNKLAYQEGKVDTVFADSLRAEGLITVYIPLTYTVPTRCVHTNCGHVVRWYEAELPQLCRMLRITPEKLHSVAVELQKIIPGNPHTVNMAIVRLQDPIITNL